SRPRRRRRETPSTRSKRGLRASKRCAAPRPWCALPERKRRRRRRRRPRRQGTTSPEPASTLLFRRRERPLPPSSPWRPCLGPWLHLHHVLKQQCGRSKKQNVVSRHEPQPVARLVPPPAGHQVRRHAHRPQQEGNQQGE